MNLIATDKPDSELSHLLEGFEHPAILVSADYRILATNALYQERFGPFEVDRHKHCYEVSHGYSVPCDQAGEDCPLAAAKASQHKTRVLHIHQTPRGKEHVDVELVPILNDEGELLYFVELLKQVPTSSLDTGTQNLVGKSPAFNQMLAQITRVSNSNASVLLLGESGAGKELAANAVHQGSSRREQHLVTLECAGLSDALFESELFGHTKGAFTGAHSNKKGLVEYANGGTLFLDEVGDVPLSMQVKLLRLLETGTYRAVGSTQSMSSDFRLVCATHKNLAAMVEAGEFRQDLYYRINVFPIYVPSLRERQQDLGIIIEALLKRLSPNKAFYVTESGMRALRLYPFPGNIRELKNILNRAIVLADTNVIDEDTVEACLAIDKQYDQRFRQNQSTQKTLNISAPEQWVDLKTAEQQYLKQLMQAHNNDKEAVAKIAGLSLRSLYRKLEDI